MCGRGGVTFVQKVKAAEQAGAAGVIAIQNDDKWPHTMSDSTGEGANCQIPAALFSKETGEQLLEWIRSHPFEQLNTTVGIRELASCSICQECFRGEAARLPCRHCFHPECVSKWLEKSRTCPLCRFQLPTDPACDQLFWRDEMKVADAIHDRGAPCDMFG